MPNPVVHFEVIGTNPERLRQYYNALCSGGNSRRPLRSPLRCPTLTGTASSIWSKPMTVRVSAAAWAGAQVP